MSVSDIQIKNVRNYTEEQVVYKSSCYVKPNVYEERVFSRRSPIEIHRDIRDS